MKRFICFPYLFILCGSIKIEFLREYLKIDENLSRNVNFVACNYKEVVNGLMGGLLGAQISFGNVTMKTGRSLKVLDYTCKNSGTQNVDFQRVPFKYLIVIDEDSEEILKGKLENLPIFLNIDVTVAFLSGEIVKVHKIYKLCENCSLVWQHLTNWSRGSALNYNYTFGGFRTDFGKLSVPFAFVVKDVAASVIDLEDYDPWTDAQSKVNYATVKRLAEYYNMTPEFVFVSDYTHLKSRKMSSNYFLTGSAPYLTKDYVKWINFVRITKTPKLCYILREPPASFVSTIFTVALENSVWYAVLITLVLLSAALYVLLNIEAKRRDIKGQVEFTGYDMALIALEAVCQQGTSTDPRSYSARILTVIMFTAFMFVYVSYSANLLVLLQSTTRLNSEREIFHYGIDHAGLNTSNFSYYHSDIGQTIFKENIKAQRTYSLTEGMEILRSGLFAFYTETRYAMIYAKFHFTPYEVCSLQTMDERPEFNLGYGAMDKDSPYYELAKVGLLRIEETGFFAEHFLKYFSKPQCYSKGSSFDAIGIRETYQVMLLWIYGTLGALAILLVEMFLRKMFAKRILVVKA